MNLKNVSLVANAIAENPTWYKQSILRKRLVEGDEQRCPSCIAGFAAWLSVEKDLDAFNKLSASEIFNHADAFLDVNPVQSGILFNSTPELWPNSIRVAWFQTKPADQWRITVVFLTHISMGKFSEDFKDL